MTPHCLAPSPIRSPRPLRLPAPVSRLAELWAALVSFARLAGRAAGYGDAVPVAPRGLAPLPADHPAVRLRLALVRAHLRRLELAAEALALARGPWVRPARVRCADLRRALLAWERACLAGRPDSPALPDLHALGEAASDLVALAACADATRRG